MSRRLAMSFVLLLTAVCAAAVALPGAAQANGCPLRFSQGTAGTSADPIRIDTAADLAVLASNASCYANFYEFRQTADITLTGVWTPIGPYNAPFNGTYDGGGHTINGLLVDQAAIGSWKGLFGGLDGATVRNLRIAHGTIVGISSYYGVLAGAAWAGSLIENVAIVDSSVSSAGHGSEYMGLVVGGLNSSTVRNATVTGGSVAIAVTNDYVGGITGRMYGGSVVERSSADVSISGAGSYVGGLVGIVETAGTITDSYARGSVQGTYAVGGLLGAFYNGGGPITRSYSTTRVTSTQGIGGLVGGDYVQPAADAVASFWDTQTSGVATSANGAVGKTTGELKALSTFADAGWPIAAGFDAARTWGICAGANDGYPFLTFAYTAAASPCATSVPTTPSAAAPAPARIVVRNARIHGNAIHTQATVPGPGAVRQVGGVQEFRKGVVESREVAEAHEDVAFRATRATLMVSCTATRTAKAAGTVALRCPLNARTLNLLTRRAVVIRLVTTFKPTGGKAVSASTVVALPKRAARPAGSTAPAVTG